MAESFELTIASSSGDYSVRIAQGEFARLLAAHPSAPIIADEFFRDSLSEHAQRTLFLGAEEGQKTLSSAERLIAELRDRGTARGDRLIVVGGGIPQDVGTLVASLYMRGLAWSYAPTTLLAMADSCIGGKSSINVGAYKNLAGNFYPPGEISIDPAFISTLLPEDRAGGLCEAMKISFCRGPETFAEFRRRVDHLQADGEGGVELLALVLGAKKWFIEVDEFDRAERRLLNFGHTFGHALEAATDFGVSHGIGVGIGVLAAERLAVALDGHQSAQPELATQAAQLVRQAPELAARLGAADMTRFDQAFLSDKKHGPDGLHLILPGAGAVVTERVLPRGDATMSAIHSALDEAIDLVTR